MKGIFFFLVIDSEGKESGTIWKEVAEMDQKSTQSMATPMWKDIWKKALFLIFLTAAKNPTKWFHY